MKNQRGIISLILVALIAAGLAGGAVYIWQQRRAVNQTGTDISREGKVNPYKDWQAYSDSDFKLSFKYPKEWGEVAAGKGAPSGKLMRFSNNNSIVFGAFTNDGFGRGSALWDFNSFTLANGKYYWAWEAGRDELTPIKIIKAANTDILVVDNNSFAELKEFFGVGILAETETAGLVNLKSSAYPGIVVLNKAKESEDMFDGKPSPGPIPAKDFELFLSSVSVR